MKNHSKVLESGCTSSEPNRIIKILHYFSYSLPYHAESQQESQEGEKGNGGAL